MCLCRCQSCGKCHKRLVAFLNCSQFWSAVPQSPVFWGLPFSSRLYVTVTLQSSGTTPSTKRLAATCLGIATVPSIAEKSRLPTCVELPSVVLNSKNIAPFLGASWDMRSRWADAGSDTCRIRSLNAVTKCDGAFFIEEGLTMTYNSESPCFTHAGKLDSPWKL